MTRRRGPQRAAHSCRAESRLDYYVGRHSGRRPPRYKYAPIRTMGKAKELRKRPNAKAKASKDVGKIFGDPTGKKTEAELEEEFNKKV